MTIERLHLGSAPEIKRLSTGYLHHERLVPSRTHQRSPFAPRAFVLVNVGRTAINLYPVIDNSMPPHERAHAFHINVTALSSQSIDLRAELPNALGHQLNLSATVDGVIQDWLCYFYNRWSDFSRLSILSFHNRHHDRRRRGHPPTRC